MSNCPCCGQEVNTPQPRWDSKQKIVFYKDRSVSFSDFRANIFDCLWRSSQEGRSVDVYALIDAAYGKSIRPDDASSSVILAVTKIRAALQGIGLNVTNKRYMITKWEGSQEQMAAAVMRSSRMDRLVNGRHQMGNAS